MKNLALLFPEVFCFKIQTTSD